MSKKRKTQGALLEDPQPLNSHSSLEALRSDPRVRCSAVRNRLKPDPWVRLSLVCDNDAIIERKRRKLQEISLNRDEELGENAV
jgi:hypothetical protein